jgi:hypothetical protein
MPNPTVNRNSPKAEAAFLRAEGRFAVMVGAILMGIGLLLACGLAIASLAAGISSLLPAAVAAAPVLLGWAALWYGAWRFEQALAVTRGRRPRRLHLRLTAQRLRAAALKRRPVQTAEPAAQPEDQAHWKL